MSALTYSQVRAVAEQRAAFEGWDRDPGHRPRRWAVVPESALDIAVPVVIVGLGITAGVTDEDGFDPGILWAAVAGLIFVLGCLVLWLVFGFWAGARGKHVVEKRYVRFRDPLTGDFLVLFDEGDDSHPTWLLPIAGRFGSEVPMAGAVRFRSSGPRLREGMWAHPIIDGVMWQPEERLKSTETGDLDLGEILLMGRTEEDPGGAPRSRSPVDGPPPPDESGAGVEPPAGVPSQSTPPLDMPRSVLRHWSEERDFPGLVALVGRRSAREEWAGDPERRVGPLRSIVLGMEPLDRFLASLLVFGILLSVTTVPASGAERALIVGGTISVAVLGLLLLRWSLARGHSMRMRYVRFRDEHRGDSLVLLDEDSNGMPEWVVVLGGRLGPQVPLSGVVELRCGATPLTRRCWVRPVFGGVVWHAKYRCWRAESTQPRGLLSRVMNGEPEPPVERGV